MSCLNSKYLYIYDIEKLIKPEKGGGIKSIAYDDILSICLVYLPRTTAHMSFILTAIGLYRMTECIYTCWRYLHRNNTDNICHE